MQAVPGTVVLTFSHPSVLGFDTAEGEAVCHLLRRKEGIQLAAHRKTEYDPFHIRVVPEGPRINPIQAFQDACQERATQFDELLRLTLWECSRFPKDKDADSAEMN